MKRLVYVFFVVVFLILLGCDRDLKLDVNTSDDNIDLNEKIMAIQQRLINGEISQQQAQDMTQNLGEYSIEDIKNIEKVIILPKILGLPDRAKKLGLTEPVGMILDQDISKITSVDDENEGFDSALLVYKGTYDNAILEASRIANLASIPISKEFQQAKEIENGDSDILNQMGDDIKNSMKGIVYSNSTLTDTNINFLINISVQEDGTLTINAANYEQMQQAIKNS